MKILSLFLTVLISCLFITGVIWAANTFPTSLNNWGPGDTIESDWADALEAKIGIDSSAVVTSIDYLIKNTGSKLGKIASLGVTDNNIIVANGTTWAVGTPGTDYSAGTAGLTTGILKSTTTTGALTIAVAGDFPTLNQNTTGSSASCTGNAATATTASGLSCSNCVDISSETNLAAGRSLTLSGDSVYADAETYVFKAKIAFEDPTADDDFFFEEMATATTFSSIYCKTLVGTVTLDVTIAGTDINGTDITCTTSGVLDSSLGGDTAGAVGEELKLAITSVASAPTYLMVQVNGSYND